MKTPTLYNFITFDKLAWKEIAPLRTRIIAHVAHIKKNGFPTWYKESKFTQPSDDFFDGEKERIEHDRWLALEHNYL